VWAVTTSDDGLWIASGAWDSSVKVYHLPSLLKMLDGGSSWKGTAAINKGGGHDPDSPLGASFCPIPCGANVWAVSFRPRKDTLFTQYSILATGSTDSMLRLWSFNHEDTISDGVGEWFLTAVLKGHTNTVTSIAWHPAGEMLVSASFDKTVRLWGKVMKQYVPMGIWATYPKPTMAVSWGYQDPHDKEGRGTVIAIATMTGFGYVMDATDAGQKCVPFGRAQHMLLSAGDDALNAISDVFMRYPETLMSLGPSDHGMFLLWGILIRSQDKNVLPFLLDCARDYSVSPLLPYTPQNVAILTQPDYHLVAAIIDTIIQMYENGDTNNVTLLTTGYGTLSILQLIKNFPDQAVVLLNHFGMTPASDVVYDQNWNPHQLLVDGVRSSTCQLPSVTETRVPEKLWRQQDTNHNGLYAWNQDDQEHTVAAHATFPYITGLPLSEWYSEEGSFHGNRATDPLDFRRLESSFLHVAYNSHDPLLFDPPLSRAIVQWKWNAYGRRYFVTQFFCFIALLCGIIWQCIAWGTAYRVGPDNYPGYIDCGIGALHPNEHCPNVPPHANASAWFVLITSLLHVGFEVYQAILLNKKYFEKFRRSFWALYDLVLYGFLVASGICGLEAFVNPNLTPKFTALAAFLLCLKSLYFFRAFSSTGGLVRLVGEIFFKMMSMFAVVGIGWAACTFAFYALPPHEYFGDDSLENSLDNVWEVMFFVYCVMMAAFEPGNFTVFLSQFITLLFSILQSVLLLNALIALMSDTTEKIKENIQVIALRERAGMLLEMELIYGKRKMSKRQFRPRWLHALVKDEDVTSANKKALRQGSRDGGSSVACSGAPQGGGGAGGVTKQELSEMANKLSKMIDSKLERLTATLAEMGAAAAGQTNGATGSETSSPRLVPGLRKLFEVPSLSSPRSLESPAGDQSPQRLQPPPSGATSSTQTRRRWSRALNLVTATATLRTTRQRSLSGEAPGSAIAPLESSMEDTEEEQSDPQLAAHASVDRSNSSSAPMVGRPSLANRIRKRT